MAGARSNQSLQPRGMMRRCLSHIAVSLLVCCTLSGCLIGGTLDKDGGGTVSVRMRLMSVNQFADVKKQMQSSDVTLTNATLDDDKWATFNLKFADVTKLSTIKLFNRTKFALTNDDGGTKTLTVTHANTSPALLTKDMSDYFGDKLTLVMHLPGDVVKSNA